MLQSQGRPSSTKVSTSPDKKSTDQAEEALEALSEIGTEAAEVEAASASGGEGGEAGESWTTLEMFAISERLRSATPLPQLEAQGKK